MGWSQIVMMAGNAMPAGGGGVCALLAVALLAGGACPPGPAEGESGVVDEWDSVPVPERPE